MRFKLTLEYDGAPFFGWQRLSEGPSVQGALEDAMFKLTGAHCDVVGAGRTDSGVHALGQIAHVDIDRTWSPDRVRDAINAHVRPHPIAVLKADEVAEDFHARFDAVRRIYRYRVINRRAPLTLDRGRAWRVPRKLDIPAMQAAAACLIGQHDFTTFRDTRCRAKNPVRTLERCEILRAGEDIHFWCEARAFLHRQVRSMVGTLIEVGYGKLSAQDVADALNAADRTRCGPVAPADGLCLMRVDY